MSRDFCALDRRRFLKATAAVGVATFASPFAAAEKPDDPFAGFRVGAQSYTFRKFTTEQALSRLHDLGLHYVEFFQQHAPCTDNKAQIDALLRLCKGYDVKPAAWGVQHFTKEHDQNRKYFDFGQALGIKMLSADPDPDSFDSLDKLCEDYKIAIGIHPHGPQALGRLHRWYSAETILAAVKDHNPLIGSCLDTGHLIRAAQLGKKLDPAQQIRLMGDRNFGIHLKDHVNERHTDVVLGKGVLDVNAVLKALRDVHFKGMISIEYEASPEDPYPDVKECVGVIMESARKVERAG